MLAWTGAAILCLAIATGADTAAFTVVNGLLLRPLPFEHPEQLGWSRSGSSHSQDRDRFRCASKRCVFAYAAVVTGLAAVLCGLAPIRYAGRIDVLEVLKQSSAKGRSRETRRRLNAMARATDRAALQARPKATSHPKFSVISQHGKVVAGCTRRLTALSRHPTLVS